MKNLTSLSFIILTIVSLWGGLVTPVHAEEKEAGSAGQLAQRVAEPDTRVEQLRDYLLSHNSPLAHEAAHFVREADRLNLDWRLVAAIAGAESTFGKRIPAYSYNGWGWAVYTGQQSGKVFRSWEDGITTVSEGLRYRYIDRGATSIEQIGRIYAASPHWAKNVRFFMNKITAYKSTSASDLDVTL